MKSYICAPEARPASLWRLALVARNLNPPLATPLGSSRAVQSLPWFLTNVPMVRFPQVIARLLLELLVAFAAIQWVIELALPGFALHIAALTITAGSFACWRCWAAARRLRAVSDGAQPEMQARFRALVEGTDVIVWEYDAVAGRFTYVSPQALRMGYPLHAWLEPGFWQEHIHPDDREEADRFCREEVLAGRNHRFQYRMLNADGSAIWVDDSVSIERDATGGTTLRGVLIDITDELEAKRELAAGQARIRAVIDTALDAVVSMNAAGIVTAWNRQAEAIFGWSESEALGRPLEELIVPEEHRAAHRAGLARYLSTGVGRVLGKRIEIPAIRKDGSRIFIELAINPIRFETEVAFSAFLRDISPRRQAEEALRQARIDAETASRSKSEFLANMSHEIRTPMTAILGYTDLLAEHGDRHKAPPERLQYVDTIRRNGEHLMALINDILDLSKIEAGRMSVERVPVSAAQVLLEVDSLMLVRARAKGIALSVELATPIPQTIQTDPVRFRQILMNLVGNAIKFTEIGGVTIRVGLDTAAPAGPALRFDVADTGIGMSAEQVSRLFQPFSQADTSTTRKFGGTGLGLRISKNLAQLLGGDVSVQSTVGKGSNFTAIIPTGPIDGVPMLAVDAIRVAALAPQSPAPAEDQPLRGVRIFFAEDGPDNQRLIAFHLRRAGAEVRIFDNGRLTLQALTTTGEPDGPLADPPPCDFILTDMQMPEIDGYTLARTLRTAGWKRPIIALTAHAMLGDADKCRDAGCDDYASKPVNRDKLINICLRAAARARPLSPVAADRAA